MQIYPPPGAVLSMLQAIEAATRAARLLSASPEEIAAAVQRGHDVHVQPREVLPQ